MLDIEIISNGQLKEKYLRDACEEYEKRIRGYARLSFPVYKDEKDIIGNLDGRAFRIALCVEGEEMDSLSFAKLLDRTATNGHSKIQFVIGPSEGLSEETKRKCDMRLSFSKMTFPHQLMRVILEEQIYRALNINAGGSYNK